MKRNRNQVIVHERTKAAKVSDVKCRIRGVPTERLVSVAPGKLREVKTSKAQRPCVRCKRHRAV